MLHKCYHDQLERLVMEETLEVEESMQGGEDCILLSLTQTQLAGMAADEN